MVAVFTICTIGVFVWLVGTFLASMVSGGLFRSTAHRQAVERRQAGMQARAIRVKQALDAEAFAAHRRMVAHAMTEQRKSR
ncbi:hypothetical protein [Flexivirga oryzae]|uniref:Uncharacterized protein n=1 Tax=Flexivirga oryzae TaxID=1794944 RepID=A0A839N4M8_9MICO|nr:hypothetical protein [Flexivirga oryzae]MBB2890953.1 hypothetical protein [Flexivirga oryzae]